MPNSPPSLMAFTLSGGPLAMPMIFCFGSLRLKDERRQILSCKRIARRDPDDFAPVLLDDLRGVVLPRRAECELRSQAKPSVAAAFDDLLRWTDCQRMRVEKPIAWSRASRICRERRPHRSRGRLKKLFLVIGHLLHRKAHRRDWHVDNQVPPALCRTIAARYLRQCPACFACQKK